MRIQGIVSKIDPRRGDFKNDQGESIAYDFDLITVLVDGLDPVEVRVNDDKRRETSGIERGQEVVFDVEVPKGSRLTLLQRLTHSPAGK